MTPGIFSIAAAASFILATEWSISHVSIAVDWYENWTLRVSIRG